MASISSRSGGKSPAIVSRGHVNAPTTASLVFGKLSNGGQTCVAPDYALVHEDDLDAFVTQYEATVARFYPHGPASPDYTSIISIVLSDYAPAPIAISAVHPAGRRLPAKVRAFIDFLLETLPGQLAMPARRG